MTLFETDAQRAMSPLEKWLAQQDGRRDGATFDGEQDTGRLNAQAKRVFVTMADGSWWTLAQLAERTGDPEASVSARLRDLRKERFGGFTVERRRVVGGERGLHEYRLVLLPEVES